MKLTPGLLEAATFPDVIDSSILSSYACPVKFFYKYCIGLSGGKSIHLSAGGAFAKGVEVVRRAFYLEKKPLDLAIYDGIRAFTNAYGDDSNLPTDGSSGSYKDYVNMTAALLDYFRQYDPATDVIQPYIMKSGKPAVEFTFAIPLPILHPTTGNPILYAGRADMLGVYDGAMNVILDEKTGYSLPQNVGKQYQMRGQFLGYKWAAREHGIKTDAAVVRCIAIQQTGIKHLEAMITYEDWQVDRWHDEMLHKVETLKAYWVAGEMPLSYGDACTSYGGCELMDMCQVTRPEDWLSSYTIDKWNPLNHDKDD